MESSITFPTPSCWEVHDFNTTLCREYNRKSTRFFFRKLIEIYLFSAPQPHQNLTSTHTLVSKGVYNINVTWEPIEPKRQPMYYIVSILPHYAEMHEADDAHKSFDTVSLNVTGVSILANPNPVTVIRFIVNSCISRIKTTPTLATSSWTVWIILFKWKLFQKEDQPWCMSSNRWKKFIKVFWVSSDRERTPMRFDCS